MDIEIREAQPEDAERYLMLLQTIDSESTFLRYETGERKRTVEEQRQMLLDMKSRDYETILVATKSGDLMGYVMILGSPYKKKRHCAEIILGVLKDFQGQGVGTVLIEAAESWAKGHRIQRIEFTVRTDNEKAVHLYEKLGYEKEGTKRHTIKINDEFFDDYMMAKLL